MLVMMNTTRPMTIDGSISTRYLCTECGQWCTAIYDLTQVFWEDKKAKLELDPDKDEEIYFIGNTVTNRKNEKKLG